eukprot:632392-Prorocentrum_minimum.AAC.1
MQSSGPEGILRGRRRRGADGKRNPLVTSGLRRPLDFARGPAGRKHVAALVSKSVGFWCGRGGQQGLDVRRAGPRLVCASGICPFPTRDWLRLVWSSVGLWSSDAASDRFGARPKRGGPEGDQPSETRTPPAYIWRAHLRTRPPQHEDELTAVFAYWFAKSTAGLRSQPL